MHFVCFGFQPKANLYQKSSHLVTVCDICDKLYKESCLVHGPMEWIHSSAVTKKQPTSSMAKTSLPNALIIKPSSLVPEDSGVFALNDIPTQVKFGPLVGREIPVKDVSPKATQDFLWEVSIWVFFISFMNIKCFYGNPDQARLQATSPPPPSLPTPSL